MTRTDDSEAEREIERLLDRQDGVVSRRQVLDAGLDDADIRRRVRRREWVPLHPGVYVDHTGEPTPRQRGWAAVLAVWPAALAHESARQAFESPQLTRVCAPIHVAVDRDRAVRPPSGAVVHRVAAFDRKVMWNRRPPTLRYEDVILDLASGATEDFAAIDLLSSAVQGRRTTAARLLRTLDARRRIPRRALLRAILTDVASGTCSTLEHAYLNRVERPHRLPVAARQVRASSRGTIYRDVVYQAFGLVVELDGRLFHDTARQRDLDLDRDLDAVVDGLIGVRLGWGQVVVRSCRTAAKIGALLNQRGWTGSPRSCPACPTDLSADRVDLQSPGDCDPPRSA